MKKLFITLALACVTVPALAQHHGHGFRHNHHFHGYHRGSWVAPLVIGAGVGYVLTRPEPIFVQQQPVIVQQDPPVIVQNQNCTAWKEIQTPDGRIYKERTCTN